MKHTPNDLKRIGTEWIDRIGEAEDREDSWIEDAKVAEAAYLVDRTATGHEIPDFNILHSNVETIVPAIYNSTPKPDIRPRHNARDRSQKYIADIHERAIMALIDDNALDKEIEAGAQDAFMAGRDVVRIKLDANVQEMVIVDPLTGEESEAEPQVSDETVIYECVSWRDFRMGPAKRWRDVPWVAYGHDVSNEEREALENPEYKLEDDKKDGPKDCRVWEIWDKETRRVFFVVEETCHVLNIVDDPLGLKGFFPQGAPVQPIQATGKMTPVCPYSVYKVLAQELDQATKRICKIMRGLKVRGLIAGDASIADLMAQAGDNDLVPVPNVENLVAIGGLDKAISWWPADMAIAVLRELYTEREETKQAIYEITGISDIIRGQGAASETATAQNIKTQWGSLRIKKMQRLIERQVRDLFTLTAEVVAKHFSAKRITQLSGMELTPEIEQAFRDWESYRIDIETDSTVRADATANRQEMSEFLNGTAAFFSTMAPIVAQAPAATAPLAKMYSAFARQFNLGKEAEDALEQFVEMAEQAAENPPPNPQAEAMKAEAEMKMSELQAKMQDMQARSALEVQKLHLQAENLGLDADLKRQELELKRGQLDLEESKAEIDAAVKLNEVGIEQEQERPVRIG